MTVAPSGYRIGVGSTTDQPKLLYMMRRHYAELYPEQPQDHLEITVDQYLSLATPLWWATPVQGGDAIACLWLGRAVDQRNGAVHAYVLLLYVEPEHRRRGLATALLQQGHHWAIQQGYPHISLQVFVDNHPARKLYESLGYQPDAILMKKSLGSSP